MSSTGDRPRTAWKAAFFAVAAVAIVVGAGWALLGSRFLVVRSVHVTISGRLVSRGQVVSAADVPAGLPLIRVNTGAVARRVERIPQVQSATVSKSWPNALVIRVRSRIPVFVVASGPGYAVIDRFGVRLRQVAHRPAGLPLLTLGPQAVGGPAVSAAATVLRELPHQVARRVREVTAADASDVSVRLGSGTVVIWGDTSAAGQKAEELTLLMRRHARLYDVSSPGTAATKR